MKIAKFLFFAAVASVASLSEAANWLPNACGASSGYR